LSVLTVSETAFTSAGKSSVPGRCIPELPFSEKTVRCFDQNSQQSRSDGTDRRKELLAVGADRKRGVAGIREYTNEIISEDLQRAAKKNRKKKSAGLGIHHYR
jgi:hypothetical protein